MKSALDGWSSLERKEKILIYGDTM